MLGEVTVFIRCLLCVKYPSKSFMYLSFFNPWGKSAKQMRNDQEMLQNVCKSKNPKVSFFFCEMGFLPDINSSEEIIK
jgi:hypothetical protein